MGIGGKHPIQLQSSSDQTKMHAKEAIILKTSIQFNDQRDMKGCFEEAVKLLKEQNISLLLILDVQNAQIQLSTLLEQSE
jgi:ATP:corrinoid adenosyltransferase